MVTGALRADGASRFGKDNRWGGSLRYRRDGV